MKQQPQTKSRQHRQRYSIHSQSDATIWRQLSLLLLLVCGCCLWKDGTNNNNNNNNLSNLYYFFSSAFSTTSLTLNNLSGPRTRQSLSSSTTTTTTTTLLKVVTEPLSATSLDDTQSSSNEWKNKRQQQQQRKPYNNKNNNKRGSSSASVSTTITASKSVSTTEELNQRVSSSRQRQRNLKTRKQYNNNRDSAAVSSSSSSILKWENAIATEHRLSSALEALQSMLSVSLLYNTTLYLSSKTLPTVTAYFPDIRVCNAALATFGDHGDLLRALRLYFKMRKASQLVNQRKERSPLASIERNKPSAAAAASAAPTIMVPTPTLVTYSTLMSRAISLGKPKVALRLWNIMKNQPNFFTSSSASSSSSSSSSPSSLSAAVNNKYNAVTDVIVPDVKAANILMNCYAKLNDIDKAENLMFQIQTQPSNTSVFGGGNDVPYMQPNLVTFNTLLDACHRTGELDKALYWKEQLEIQSEKQQQKERQLEPKRLRQQQQQQQQQQKQGGRYLKTFSLHPDARTYTSLIATVARKAGQTSSGIHDPSLAFQLLEEMKTKHHIVPNGMTYSALIDVCGRCKRSDLALQALRLMLDEQKKQQQRQENNSKRRNNSLKKGLDEASAVSAWTAAINACGKAGRIDTAIKLFFVSMPRFHVQPNTITCGCLTDCLLKHGRTTKVVEILRYMKQHDIPPSEVMYTSLMTYASRLAKLEKQNYRNGTSKQGMILSGDENELYQKNEPFDTGAVQIYSELMSTVVGKGVKRVNTETPRVASLIPHNEELYQVSLVFQEMKAGGVEPDLMTYNVLLRSIANAGDVKRAQEIFQEIQENENLEPNNKTWREMLRAAGKAKRADVVLRTWKMIMEIYSEEPDEQDNAGTPSPSRHNNRKHLHPETLQAMLLGLLICSANEPDLHTRTQLYKLIVKCYKAILSNSDYLGMSLVDAKDVLSNSHIMACFLQAVVHLEYMLSSSSSSDSEDAKTTDRRNECDILRKLGASIASSECLDPSNIPFSLKNNYHFEQAWKAILSDDTIYTRK